MAGRQRRLAAGGGRQGNAHRAQLTPAWLPWYHFTLHRGCASLQRQQRAQRGAALPVTRNSARRPPLQCSPALEQPACSSPPSRAGACAPAGPRWCQSPPWWLHRLRSTPDKALLSCQVESEGYGLMPAPSNSDCVGRLATSPAASYKQMAVLEDSDAIERRPERGREPLPAGRLHLGARLAPLGLDRACPSTPAIASHLGVPRRRLKIAGKARRSGTLPAPVRASCGTPGAMERLQRQVGRRCEGGAEQGAAPTA